MTSPAGLVYLAASPHGDAFPTMVARALDGVKARLEGAGQRRKPRVAISYAAVAGTFGGRAVMKGYALKTFWGAETHAFHVAGEPSTMDPKEAEEIVATADLVFLTGGDPALGARLLCDAGADAWLRAARARGIPCIGVSAGAIMLCAWWASWPEEPPPDAPWDGGRLVPCARVVDDLVVDCHAEEDAWSELRLVRGMVEARSEAHPGAKLPRFLGLPTGCGVIVGPNGETEWLGVAPFEG
jgi:putative intracellular protease/amidase